MNKKKTHSEYKYIMCFGNKILLRVFYPLACTNIIQHHAKAMKTNEAFIIKSYSKMKQRSSLLSNGEFYYMLLFKDRVRVRWPISMTQTNLLTNQTFYCKQSLVSLNGHCKRAHVHMIEIGPKNGFETLDGQKK